MHNYPAFLDLPLREGDPPLSAWGLWGEKDELGTLVNPPFLSSRAVKRHNPADLRKNHLTPDVVQKAVLEASTGLRFSLK